jgi:predicted AlkP superfamily pyrophosphatase or phosphodiesterase
MVINANDVIGTHHILFITFDSLRYDVARAALHAGHTPHLASLLPGGKREERRTQGSFTLPAHMSFFAGFLPVPSGPDRAHRLFACQSPRGTTIGDRTHVFDAPDIVTGLADTGYRTVCIGGIGFFSQQTPLGSVLPALFQDTHWKPDTGPDSPYSTRHQVDFALEILDHRDPAQPLFLFLNISATHTPTHVYLPGATTDSWDTQYAALAYADKELGRLFRTLPRHGPWLALLCADHGEAFGEDGHHGHGIAHPTVLNVPYAETLIPPATA